MSSNSSVHFIINSTLRSICFSTKSMSTILVMTIPALIPIFLLWSFNGLKKKGRVQRKGGKKWCLCCQKLICCIYYFVSVPFVILLLYSVFSPIEKAVVIRDENLSINRDSFLCPDIRQEQDIDQYRNSHCFWLKMITLFLIFLFTQ